jgi:hypothetical protein
MFLTTASPSRIARLASSPKRLGHYRTNGGCAGFIIMGLTLTLNRMGRTGKALSIGLMTTGTALVFVGLYTGGGLW